MKVYASTACVGGLDIWATLGAYREAGICAVELGAVRGAADTAALDERLATSGLRLVIHNYFPPAAEPFVLNLASPDDGVRARSLALVDRALALSERLAAPFYSIHAGFVRDPVGFDGTSFVFPDPPPGAAERDEAERRFAEALAEAAARAAGRGVRLLVENHVFAGRSAPYLLLETAADFERAVSEAGAGVLLDTGHLAASAKALGFDRHAYLRRLAPLIGALHLHENDGTRDAHLPIAAGGWVETALREPALAAAARVVEARFASVEELRRHVEWLRSLS